MMEQERKTYDLEGIGRVYCWGSSTNPQVILLHGFMQTSLSWNEVATDLSRDFFLIAPDLLGFGETGIPEGETFEKLTLDAYVQQLDRLIDWARAQKGTKPSSCNPSIAQSQPAETISLFPPSEGPALAGYSLGGRIAATYATRRPEQIGALVLESAGLGPESDEEREARQQKSLSLVSRLEDSIASNPTAPLCDFVDFWEGLPLFGTQVNLDVETRERVRKERLANDPEMLKNNLVHAGQHTMEDLRLALVSLDKPILYVTGARDVAYTEIARSLMRAWALRPAEVSSGSLGSLQVLEVPGVGHNVHLEAPEEFVVQLRAFLQRSGIANRVM